MNPKLFSLYFRYRKPLIALSVTFTTITTAIYRYQKHQSQVIPLDWKVEQVLSGDSFQVSLARSLDEETSSGSLVNNGKQTKTISLCGIAAKTPESKTFLASLIDRGNGTVELQKVGNSYEAWVMLRPDFENQIHLNTWMVEKGMAALNNHKKCLGAENLEWAAKASL